MIAYLSLPRCHGGQSSKYNEAKRSMLEDILTVQSTGIFDETRWNCDGSTWNSEGCSALRSAIFCLSNYYFIQRVSSNIKYLGRAWFREDKDEMAQFSALCSKLVPIWQVGAVADCEEAMVNLGLQFPSPQCMHFKRLLRHYTTTSGARGRCRMCAFINHIASYLIYAIALL